MSNETQDFELPEDIFQREEIAKSMCELICTSPADAISPVVLQGPWGSGKSTHAMRMMKCIQKNYATTHKCIYWNASIYDYAADPLPLFVATLYSETAPNDQDSFTRAGFKLCGTTALAVTKEFFNQLIRDSYGFDFKGIAEAACEAQGKAENPSLQQFKTFLKEAGTDKVRIDTAKELLNLARGGRELIIIIDELDRCRPDFALQMIETIKHLFTNKHCKFILVMNKQSLINAIQNIYGLNPENADTYLNKFITLSLQLPNLALGYKENMDFGYYYFGHLMGQNFNRVTSNFQKLVLSIIKKNKLQLREIEKWVNTIKRIQRINKSDFSKTLPSFEEMTMAIVAFLISRDTNMVFKIVEKNITWQEFAEYLGIFGLDLDVYMPTSGTRIKLSKIFDYYIAMGTKKENAFFTSEEELYEAGPIENAARFFKEWIQYSLFIRSL